MNPDPIAFYSVGSLLFLAFMISVARNLRRLRKEAEKQTALLERLVPATPPAKPRPSESYEDWRRRAVG